MFPVLYIAPPWYPADKLIEVLLIFKFPSLYIAPPLLEDLELEMVVVVIINWPVLYIVPPVPDVEFMWLNVEFSIVPKPILYIAPPVLLFTLLNELDLIWKVPVLYIAPPLLPNHPVVPKKSVEAGLMPI